MNNLVGLVIAMEEEAKLISEMITKKKNIARKGQLFVTGEMESTRVVLALSGVGKVNAARTVTLMSELFSPSCIISSGVAGGLGKLRRMSVLVASAVVQHDVDLTAFGKPLGMISGFKDRLIPCSSQLLKIIKELDYNFEFGIVATGDQFVASDQKALEITTEFGAKACDMESGAVGQIAYLEGIPFAVIRVISDDANGSASDDFSAFIEKACVLNSRIIKEVIRKIADSKINWQ